MFRVNFNTIKTACLQRRGSGRHTLKCFHNFGKGICRVKLNLLVGNSC